MAVDENNGLALHWKILIALVAGTVIGVLINPGMVLLPDSSAEVSLQISGDSGSGVSVEVTDGTGLESTLRRFDSSEQMSAAFDGVGPEQIGKTSAATISVTERRLQIVEMLNEITIDYTRRQNGLPVSTSISVRRASDLPAAWQQIHSVHGGGVRRQLTAAAKYLGDLFLRLLKMVTVPLILTSLITGIAGLGSAGNFGSMFRRTLSYYLLTSVLAITTGILMVNLVRPGIGAELPHGTESAPAMEDQSLTGILLGLVDNMIPTNPVAAIANSSFLSIITFSIVFSIFLVRVGGEHARRLQQIFEAGFEVMMRLTMAIISLAPWGVACFMIYATSSQGLQIFLTLSWYMLTVAAALLVHATVTLPLLVRVLGKRSPLEFARAMSPALMTAFSTASSNGTLPLTMNSVEQRAGVSNRTSSFVLPLGATINMDGTALYEAVAVLFIAQAYRGDLALADQILVAVTALLASVGAAGIPHAGLVMMAIVLQAVNLPLEAQGVIIAVDRVLDMARTTVNVWSDSCGCAIIDGLAGQTESADRQSAANS